LLVEGIADPFAGGGGGGGRWAGEVLLRSGGTWWKDLFLRGKGEDVRGWNREILW
jgi:hypothetical protein